MTCLLCVYDSERPERPPYAFVSRSAGGVRVSAEEPAGPFARELVMYDLRDEDEMRREFESFEARFKN
jgi:hypothetical protein